MILNARGRPCFGQLRLPVQKAKRRPRGTTTQCESKLRLRASSPIRLPVKRHRPTRAATRLSKASSELCACTEGCQSQCPNRYMLVECHEGNCSLPSSLCTNRHFTAPPARDLHLFETKDGRGWGLRTLSSLQAGNFVVEYTGLRRRQEECWGSCYCISLGDGWALDARDVENQARYINHSCDPNCCVWIWIGADGEKHIAIFTIRDLVGKEELTISYGGGGGIVGQRCLCKNDNCLGFLWR